MPNLKKTIRLAAIHSNDEMLPETARPHGKKFDNTAPLRFVNDNIEKNLAFFHEAGRQKADLVCTHENFTGSGCFGMDDPDLFASMVEEIPGPTSAKLGEIAKLYNMHIAANYLEKAGEKIYNTSVLIGRDGEIIGKYRKVHVADGERWRVAGGSGFPVFETDIGRIGFATCYDMIFTEQCRSVALNGADIIIHQTQGWGIITCEMGEALLRTRALENSVYLVVSKNIQPGDGGKSCIIDNYGKIIAETADDTERVLITELSPDYDAYDEYHYDNLIAGVNSTRARLLLAREPSLYSAITNEKPPVMERYKGVELHTSPEQIKIIREKLNEIHRLKIKKYHW